MNDALATAIAQSWSTIPLSFPLKQWVASNPLAGFENMPFEKALDEAAAYFQHGALPEGMLNVNRVTIKWMQVYMDDAQAVVQMPLKQSGLYGALRQLCVFDRDVHQNDAVLRGWLVDLPASPEEVVALCLERLGVPENQWAPFLTLMLTTLPGWAAVVRTKTSEGLSISVAPGHEAMRVAYLAWRLILVVCLWPEAKDLLAWHAQQKNSDQSAQMMRQINASEGAYDKQLMSAMSSVRRESLAEQPDAQLFFCMDVRSEPLRRTLEEEGRYATFGFAGFFGLPIRIADHRLDEAYASCPVIVPPSHTIESVRGAQSKISGMMLAVHAGLKSMYASLKYTFIVPFALAESLGLFAGVLMCVRTVMPRLVSSSRLARWMGFTVRRAEFSSFNLDAIPMVEQVQYALNFLRVAGLTRDFSPLVVMCGHRSETANNAYEAGLNCGACGGHHGLPNAVILSAILNQHAVRQQLAVEGIHIPAATWFVAAQHNTTTHAVHLDARMLPNACQPVFQALQKDLRRVQKRLNQKAFQSNDVSTSWFYQDPDTRAHDWAQVQPEWGLARHAALVIGPRALTQGLDLEGRVFMHAYDASLDPTGEHLTQVLSGPMVVAQWINAQYLMSTLDNVAYGAGSKMTQNVMGKLGMMQGNASDVMHGLPMESVMRHDGTAYHQPMRLRVIVHAPMDRLRQVILQHPKLKQLVANAWIHVICCDSATGKWVPLTVT